jgi:N-acetylglucosamine-6-sulfatase
VRRLIILLAVLGAILALSAGAPLWRAYSGSTPIAEQSSPQPNIVFILADDMRYDDLRYMPKTRNQLGSQSVTFSRAHVAKPLCCPSGTSILTGMYTHNHKVWLNFNRNVGGWQDFKAQGHEQDNLATRLSGAGCRTGLIGQYLKNYDGSSVPPGRDDWFGHYGGSYYSLDVNDGTDRHYGNTASDYGTDVISNEARSFIGTSARRAERFFTYVAPIAPHSPSKAAPRDLNTYDGLKATRPPSFDEADVSDKARWI